MRKYVLFGIVLIICNCSNIGNIKNMHQTVENHNTNKVPTSVHKSKSFQSVAEGSYYKNSLRTSNNRNITVQRSGDRTKDIISKTGQNENKFYLLERSDGGYAIYENSNNEIILVGFDDNLFTESKIEFFVILAYKFDLNLKNKWKKLESFGKRTYPFKHINYNTTIEQEDNTIKVVREGYNYRSKIEKIEFYINANNGKSLAIQTSGFSKYDYLLDLEKYMNKPFKYVKKGDFFRNIISTEDEGYVIVESDTDNDMLIKVEPLLTGLAGVPIIKSDNGYAIYESRNNQLFLAGLKEGKDIFEIMTYKFDLNPKLNLIWNKAEKIPKKKFPFNQEKYNINIEETDSLLNIKMAYSESKFESFEHIINSTDGESVSFSTSFDSSGNSGLLSALIIILFSIIFLKYCFVNRRSI